MCMLNRNPKRLSAEVFSSAQKQPKQNASSQNREENGSATLRNTREKPLLAGYRLLNISWRILRNKRSLLNTLRQSSILMRESWGRDCHTQVHLFAAKKSTLAIDSTSILDIGRIYVDICAKSILII